MFRYSAIDIKRRGLLRAGLASIAAVLLAPWQVRAQQASKLRIGIIGSGRIGGTLGELWVEAGHPVLLSSRHPDELKGLAARLGPLAQAGTVAQAIEFGDALLVAVPYAALPALGQDHAGALKGKIVLDACNAIAARDGAIVDEAERSGIGIGIASQKYLAGTRLVRAFNTLSYMILAKEANRAEPRLAIPIAGDDAEVMQVAAGLVRDARFEPVTVGRLADAKRFQRGSSGYGQAVSAAELKKTLSLAP